MGQSAIKNPRRIVVLPGGGGTDPALEARVEYLEDNTYKITYFAEINGTTGTITKPTNSTILTDQFFGGVDAYVSTIQNGQPTGIFPQTAGGVAVDVTSFNAAGDFVLNGTPSAYPVALIYKLSIAAVNYQNLTIANVLDLEDTNAAKQTGWGANRVIFADANGVLTEDADFTFVSDNLNVGTSVTTPLVIGGSAVGSQLIHKSTTGNGTLTVAGHVFQVGNNGATTAAKIYNNGDVNIGNAVTTNQRLLRIGQDTAIVDIGSRVASTAQGAIYLSQTTPSNTNYNIAGDSTFSIINSPLAVANTNAVYIAHASTLNYTFFPNRISFTPTATVSGATDVFNFTTPASTNQTLSTETIGVRFNMSASIQHATGAITTQRDFVIDARTHSFVGASTITTAATLAISAAPIAGTNATITNGYALWLQSGSMLISSGILSVSAPTASNTGATVFTSSTTLTGTNSQNPNGMAFVHSGTGFGSTIYYGIGVQNRSSSALSAGMGVGILMGLGYGAGSFVNTRITSYAIGTVSSSLNSAFGIQTSIGGAVAERFTFYKESFGINTTTPNSYLQINGSVSTAYVQKTAAYVITSSDFTIECTSGTFDITLPTAVGITGRIYVIANSGAGTITLATTSSQTIDGNASGVLTLTQNKSYTVQSNNSNWVIIAVK